MIRVAVVGANGRMGTVMTEGLSACADIEVVALVDITSRGENVHASLDAVDAGTIDVVVDFSSAEGAATSLAWCHENQVAAVIGATGIDARVLSTLISENDHVVVAANFSIGAVLAERFAAIAAPHFAAVEVIELHHDAKVDAPSGTSLSTAAAIADARQSAGMPRIQDPTSRIVVEGARGAEVAEGIRIHSVRLPGLVAHEEILFGNPYEGMTIRHDSYDRRSFIAGVALAVRQVRDRKGLTIGIGTLV